MIRISLADGPPVHCVCGRAVGTTRVERLNTGGHLIPLHILLPHNFLGDAPSVWLRPGEPCPAAGVPVVEYLYDDGLCGQWERPPGLSDEEWLERAFGREWEPHPRDRWAQFQDQEAWTRGPTATNGKFTASIDVSTTV